MQNQKIAWRQCAACAMVYAGRDACPRCGDTRSFQAELAKPFPAPAPAKPPP